jgi:hypothetical protein
VLIPGSTFAPDGKSYLIYSAKRNAVIQKDLVGKEIAVTGPPAAVRCKEYHPEPPRISRDGRHLAFVCEAVHGGVLYVADLKID